MPDAQGHSWVGLGPRVCRLCDVVEGSPEVREPCKGAKTKDIFLTLVDIDDTTHIMKMLDETFCGRAVDREMRLQSCRDRTVTELDAEGTLICYACQVRWADAVVDKDLAGIAKYLSNDRGIVIDTEAKAEVLKGLNSEDPKAVMRAFLQDSETEAEEDLGRALISKQWSEDWDSEEDSIYDDK